MNSNWLDELEHVRELLASAPVVIVGAGAGLSASAGLVYSGARFENNFADFIARYQMRDMYSAAFYEFESEDEKWAYWSRHISINRYQPGATQVYQDLLALLKDKRFFVVTTNVDGQFHQTGFGDDRVFMVQGDYGKFQCATACHNVTYDNQEVVAQMLAQQQQLRIPTSLVPVCPNCGGTMEPNVRKDAKFVEDAEWHVAQQAYARFYSTIEEEAVLLLELGVGFNTPSIIKYPFERLVNQRGNTHLLRMTLDVQQESVRSENTTVIQRDIGEFLTALRS